MNGAFFALKSIKSVHSWTDLMRYYVIYFLERAALWAATTAISGPLGQILLVSQKRLHEWSLFCSYAREASWPIDQAGHRPAGPKGQLTWNRGPKCQSLRKYSQIDARELQWSSRASILTIFPKRNGKYFPVNFCEIDARKIRFWRSWAPISQKLKLVSFKILVAQVNS